MKRRNFFATSVGVSAALLVSSLVLAAETQEEPFTLPPLPYAYDALEPHIDAETMEIHHKRHHAAYIANLNRAVAGTPWASKSIEELVTNWPDLPESIRTTVRNNGGGHANHTLFWEILSPEGGRPEGALAEAIDRDLGGYDAMVDSLSKTAVGQFGSGWGWLAYDPAKEGLVILATANQDNPLTDGLVPILGIDVWEHAYYLKYQNRRTDYVKSIFEVINWEAVAKKYDAAVDR